jgi:hypothetical protein
MAEASLQNSVNDAEGQERRRTAVAMAREELHAEVVDANKAAAQYNLELLAIIGENKGYFQNKIDVIATDLDAEVTERKTLAVEVGNNKAAIQTEAQTRANADTAEAQARQTLASTVSSNTAAIQTEAQTRANADAAETQARQTLAATVGQNTAAIQTEVTTRANAVSALTSRATTLETKVGNATDGSSASGSLYARLKDEASVRASKDGKYEAYNTIRLDVNGYVSGYIQNNNGNTSNFVISADHFLVTKPGSVNPTQMLSYDSSIGKLSLNEIYVNRLTIKNRAVTSIASSGNAPSNINIAVNGTWYDASYLSINAETESGQPTDILFMTNLNVWKVDTVGYRLYRGSTLLKTWTSIFTPAIFAGSLISYFTERVTVPYRDQSVPTGVYNYKVQVRATGSESEGILILGDRYMQATTLAR